MSASCSGILKKIGESSGNVREGSLSDDGWYDRPFGLVCLQADISLDVCLPAAFCRVASIAQLMQMIVY